jgi:type 1 glutamine amidotransferase
MNLIKRILFLCLVSVCSAAAQPPAFKVLVFSATAGFRHASIPDGIALIQALAATNNFAVDATEDASLFTEVNLAQYKVIVFLNTTSDVLTNAQQMVALQHYVQAGGGWVGVHAASDTLHSWPWYGELVGAYFVSHPAIQSATIKVEDRVDPSTSMLPAAWVRTDEWYNFNLDPRSRVHVLAALDESTYSGGAMGADHPIAWSQYYDGGRAWYTASGHTSESYAEPLFQAHLLGGILFAAGVSAGHPPLTITRSGSSLQISWPSGATGFLLESNAKLPAGTGWSVVTNSPALQNGRQIVSMSVSSTNQFFRLRK